MQILTPQRFETVRSLVGHITPEDLRYVDSYVATRLCAFLPVGGRCGYAVTPEHTHNGYMFVINYDARTKVMIGERAVTSRPDSLFCLSPQIPHHEVQDYLPPRYCALVVDAPYFEALCRMHGIATPHFDGEIFDVHESTKSLLNHFLASCAETDAPRAMHDALAESLTHALIRNTHAPEAVLQMSSKRRINDAVAHLHAHYTHDLPLGDLAESAGLSVSHFRRIFKEEMGMGAHDYLLHLRLRHAKKMLAAGRHSVTEAAMASGFNSPSYFARRFREAFGEPPATYLKRFK